MSPLGTTLLGLFLESHLLSQRLIPSIICIL
jgi:hypothetical protein